MKYVLLALVAVPVVLAARAQAGPVEDASAFVTTILDKFNGGDARAFIDAHESNALIIDEFGQHVWTGNGSVERWMGDYEKDAKARGISAGRVDYMRPIAANGDASSVYVVLPTTYRFLQNGKKMAGAGSMTFIARNDGKGWKIASWTYSGATPAPER